MNSLKRIRGNEPQLEVSKTRFQRIRAGRAPTTWLRPFQRDKVPAHCIALAATFGERVFVRGGETRLGWLFSWWHTTSIADNDASIQYGLAGHRDAGLSCPRHELGAGTSSVSRAGGGGYEMIITLSRREPKPLETCEDSGALERALPIRAGPGTWWKRALGSQPCAHRTRGDRFGLTRRRGADRGCGLQATMARPACADQPTSGALHGVRACRA